MPKPSLLYLCINDGSDTRINKEVRTLAGRFAVHYVGIGRSCDRSFVRPYCTEFTLIKGHHKDKAAFLKYWQQVSRLLLTRRYEAIHVINEQLVLLFYPFLYRHRHRVVLDIFDSIFLRARREMEWLKNVTYRLPARLLVTDDNRKGLMPAAFLPKVTVVENFPYRFTEPVRKSAGPGELVIFYNGSMTLSRGTGFLRRLLEGSDKVRVRMAGWVYDEATQALTEHPQVSFLGVISQQESMRVAAECDYILSMYEPLNQNNINASPNKVYDAIQAQTPVIINREVKVAAFVERHGIGYVLDAFEVPDPERVAGDLFRRKDTFRFDTTLLTQYTWEAVEEKLLAAHRS
jgi:protein-tyrosine-phosphatase